MQIFFCSSFWAFFSLKSFDVCCNVRKCVFIYPFIYSSVKTGSVSPTWSAWLIFHFFLASRLRFLGSKIPKRPTHDSTLQDKCVRLDHASWRLGQSECGFFVFTRLTIIAPKTTAGLIIALPDWEESSEASRGHRLYHEDFLNDF